VFDSDGKDAVGSSPINDLDWVFNELIQWVFWNVHAKWASVVKRGREKVSRHIKERYNHMRYFASHTLLALTASWFV